MESEEPLLWNCLKLHIEPAERDLYAKQIGLARIARNEETYQELKMLRLLSMNVQSQLAHEIEQKNPLILESLSRKSAIERCVRFLDSLKAKGHFIEPQNPEEAKIVQYLKYIRPSRPHSTETASPRPPTRTSSARSLEDMGDIKSLLDDEFEELQAEIAALRTQIFDDQTQLEEVKSIEPPPTTEIEKFAQKIQHTDKTLDLIARQQASVGTRGIRESMRLSKGWE